MPGPCWMVAVTYLEWIRWLAVGCLRCRDRITLVRGADDQDGFFALLDRVGEFNVDDDHGILLAALVDNEMAKIVPARIGNGLSGLSLPIDAVSSFYPVSERGHRLLEADAARARAYLSRAEFEVLWIQWQMRRRRDLAEQRARNLCTALNVPMVLDGGVVREDVLNVLTGETAPRNASKAERLRGSSAYAWALSIGVFGQLTDEKAKDDYVSKLGLGDIVRKMEHDYPINMPVLKSPPVNVISHMTERLSAINDGKKLPLSLFAVVFHYRHLLETGRSVALESLVEDLSLLGVEGSGEYAGLAAGVIALSMEDAAVTTLLYKSRSHLYRALVYSAPDVSLDVGGRIARMAPVRGSVVPEETKAENKPNGLAEKDILIFQTGAVDGEQSCEPTVVDTKSLDVGVPAEIFDTSTSISGDQVPRANEVIEQVESMSLCLDNDGGMGLRHDLTSEGFEQNPLGVGLENRTRSAEVPNDARRSGKKKRGESVESPVDKKDDKQ